MGTVKNMFKNFVAEVSKMSYSEMKEELKKENADIGKILLQIVQNQEQFYSNQQVILDSINNQRKRYADDLQIHSQNVSYYNTKIQALENVISQIWERLLKREEIN